LVYSKSSFRY